MRLPEPNLPLCHWSNKLFDLRALSSTDVPVLLLKQPIATLGLLCLSHFKISAAFTHGQNAPVELSKRYQTNF